MPATGISFPATACLGQHNPQGRGSLIQEESHHIQKVLTDHNIGRVYHLNNIIQSLTHQTCDKHIKLTAYF